MCLCTANVGKATSSGDATASGPTRTPHSLPIDVPFWMSRQHDFICLLPTQSGHLDVQWFGRVERHDGGGGYGFVVAKEGRCSSRANQALTLENRPRQP